MATLHRARVVAIGKEEDMLRLCRVMLRNCGEEEDPSEELPPMKLEELLAQIQHRADEEGSPEECGFYYGMLGSRLYGHADAGTCRFRLRQEKCGLWTATFAYDSAEPFQQEDWLRLHNACDRLPMLALRASWDFAQAKGMLIYSGGHILENWERMEEAWMYLIAQYECGYPPEEAVRRLVKLQATLEREDSDLTVDALLEGCVDNLQDIADHVADPQLLKDMMERCRQARDYEGLFMLQCHAAEAALWETEHNARWLATLDTVRQAWQAHLAG